MNTSVTSKEAILENCRKLVSEKGLSSLNMRTVAKNCEVALGSLYYYFPSKNDLLIATIESVWEDIFQLSDSGINNLSFPEYIDQCFKQIQLGIKKYPNFFTIHSISFSTKGQNRARDCMEHYIAQIKEKMLCSLHSDKYVGKSIFSNEFTESDFIDFILSSVICLLVQKKKSCDTLLEVIKRTIYSH
ncbi:MULTISPECIES: TetR/AcrR family transcriptional regulator [Peptoniphilus]|uniref:TetR/AcrR family transcriptional regulator n=1 Tax=Peptoniphilus TaxID=162289 RepID=UPI0001DA9DED|nr:MULTISPECIES: TetR/AcrR family transcriptional regulator [Peptoniphilus]EFI41456.1 transcriptional regulator, TetR family [Peptoniphilus sp. oral taxon 386 str. F0131]